MHERTAGLGGKCPVTGKKQLEDEAEARHASKSLRKRRGPRTRPYECVYCHYWHIGHWRPPQARKQDKPWKKWPKTPPVDNSKE